MFFYRKANVKTHIVVDEPNENICKVVGNQLQQVDLLVMGFIVYCWRLMHKVGIYIDNLFTLQKVLELVVTMCFFYNLN